MSTSLTVVACCYRLAPEEMIRRIQRLFVGQPVRVSGFAVSAHLAESRQLQDGWTALPTDNDDFDFSAYLTGALAAAERGLADEPVLFVNDTLFTNHAAGANFKAVVRLLGVVRDIELPAIAGKTDRYTTICLRNPWNGLDQYVPTYCFLLNAKGVAALLQLRRWAEDDGVTHDHDVGSPAWGSRLAPAFREFLKASLVYQRSPYLWYRLRDGRYSAAQLRSKARCIYFEHRLSGAIGSAGCILPSNAGPRWGSYLAIQERLSRLRRRLSP